MSKTTDFIIDNLEQGNDLLECREEFELGLEQEKQIVVNDDRT